MDYVTPNSGGRERPPKQLKSACLAGRLPVPSRHLWPFSKLLGFDVNFLNFFGVEELLVDSRVKCNCFHQFGWVLVCLLFDVLRLAVTCRTFTFRFSILSESTRTNILFVFVGFLLFWETVTDVQDRLVVRQKNSFINFLNEAFGESTSLGDVHKIHYRWNDKDLSYLFIYLFIIVLEYWV